MRNICDNYTLAHINKFLHAIDGDKRVERIRNLYDLRTAQAELKHFKDQIRKLEQQDRVIRMTEARRDGRTLPNTATQEELEALNAQQHDYASDWSDDARAKFEQERSNMWALIPEAARAKAEQLAKGH